ncbi:MAG: phosphatidylserine decarboxylase family protein [Sedimentisphaerales bacterium]|nr:phosphatidylserine decarboxylase family protein [Sedimentisphaerales bacterium]
MRIPLTKYGLPQVLMFPSVILMVMLAVGLFLSSGMLWAAEIVLFIVLLWVLAFFRDPKRIVPVDKNLLLSPADGKVSDITVLEGDESPFGEKAIRIGIFLNIFNVHINRTPCSVRIDKITYKKGLFKNAMDPESSRVNESNDVEMTRLDQPCDKLLVRQISGAIARRIVCAVEAEQEFSGGYKFGMIKFGSRTELYLPSRDNVKVVVKTGDKVKAGLTVFVEYTS